MSEYFLIAEIKALFGEEGFLALKTHSDNPDRFKARSKVYVDIFDDMKEFYIEKVIRVKGNISVKFKNFNSAADAATLVGRRVYVDSSEVADTGDGIYYIHDLIGSTVLRNGRRFGLLKDVWTLPANDVYVIEDANGKEILIPAVKEFVESFDPKEKIMVLRPGDELYDENEN